MLSFKRSPHFGRPFWPGKQESHMRFFPFVKTAEKGKLFLYPLRVEEELYERIIFNIHRIVKH